MTDIFPIKPAVHFVGFQKDREYWAAVKIWGKPGFIHQGNDTRLRLEIHDSDIVIYANGCEANPVEKNYSDTNEKLD